MTATHTRKYLFVLFLLYLYSLNLRIFSFIDPKTVVHLSHRFDKYNYELCCGVTIGGVLGMRKEQFEKINGFSNSYNVIIIHLPDMYLYWFEFDLSIWKYACLLFSVCLAHQTEHLKISNFNNFEKILYYQVYWHYMSCRLPKVPVTHVTLFPVQY